MLEAFSKDPESPRSRAKIILDKGYPGSALMKFKSKPHKDLAVHKQIN